ncbi:NPP1 family protein [Streptosporangium sp. NPDC049046]|uniref:NPP1 family protein n=1 Tax=Streptosporangium sp. NPDC049046 TaxID=3155031 RepID=UPI00341D4416
MAFALSAAFSGVAFAAPPSALPARADRLEWSFQPAYDYDKDGCYPTPAIGRGGAIAPGLELGGHSNGNCRDASDLRNTNGYARAKCNNGWCAVMYALYFEKDQANVFAGHRHDWEHVVVWVKNGRPEYVSTSAHGEFTLHHRSQVHWIGTHPKIVYHKHGAQTHALRAATANDEPPENHEGRWQYPSLVGWNGYPPGFRDRLTQADFGAAQLDLKDSRFGSKLAQAKPAGIPFKPHA